jgi:hypothetical protein
MRLLFRESRQSWGAELEDYWKSATEQMMIQVTDLKLNSE